MLMQAMVVSALLGLGCVAMLYVAMPWILKLRPSWETAMPYAWLAWVAALGCTFRIVTGCFIIHEHACRRFSYLWFYAPMMLLQAAGLFLLMGWAFFEPYLPERLWSTIYALPRETLPFVITWGTVLQGIICCGIVFLAIRMQKCNR